QGPVINGWRWSSDSSGVAFLDGGGLFGDKHLVLADLRTKSLETLSSTSETVKDFDIRDRQHYVYTVNDPDLVRKLREKRQGAAIVGTGLSAWELLFPEDPLIVSMQSR